MINKIWILHNAMKPLIMRISYFFIVISHLILISCEQKTITELSAIQNKWDPINSGLTDLHIQALAIDPNNLEILYVSTFNGIFMSKNGGMSWKLANTGITSNDIKVIVLNPRNSNQLFVGTWGDGIFVSEDEAASWHSINNGIIDFRVRSIRIRSDSTQHIFAISETEYLESKDSGTSWKSSCMPYGLFQSLAIDFNRNVIYIGTFSNGIYKSQDHGATWIAISNDLPIIPDGHFDPIVALEISSGSPISLWAAIKWKGVYLSEDQGESWYCRSDGLTTTSINCMIVDKVISDLIIIGTTEGVFLSTNDVQSWYQINDGLTNRDVRALAIRYNPLVIYAGTMGDGVYRYMMK